jgi:hypothetical protein
MAHLVWHLLKLHHVTECDVRGSAEIWITNMESHDPISGAKITVRPQFLLTRKLAVGTIRQRFSEVLGSSWLRKVRQGQCDF